MSIRSTDREKAQRIAQRVNDPHHSHIATVLKDGSRLWLGEDGTVVYYAGITAEGIGLEAGDSVELDQAVHALRQALEHLQQAVGGFQF